MSTSPTLGWLFFLWICRKPAAIAVRVQIFECSPIN
nr:MAG TPA: ATP synthase [Caudoviricetes sp.]